MLDDGSNDRRRAESSTNAGEPGVGFDADQGRVTLDLRSEIGAVTLFLRNRCRHWNRGHFDDFHGGSLPGQWQRSRFGYLDPNCVRGQSQKQTLARRIS
jgi:hypothetical protein